jgi:hypothetical protein
MKDGAMPKFKITMSDTVTYTRVYSTVRSFKDECEAEAWGDEHRGDVEEFDDDTDESEGDNTPWEITVARTKEKLSSKAKD